MINDNPVSTISNDLFKRSEFAIRIANLIRNRKDKESIAFGINGAWGEGKTTVLNFITAELKKDYPKTIVIKFNPWRFSEEAKLLESFFTTISKDLSNSLSSSERKDGMSKSERQNDLKKIADILGDYGDAISEIPFPVTNLFGKIIKVASKKFSITELEEKKNKLSELISKYQRKIVIVIDDIDRLSKDEVYTILRLVKLTGDFNYFIYLLAYDEDMVSEAIGSRFGNGDKIAGKSFLEKIVQIPIKLPEILFSDLQLFFSNELEKILIENKIVIDESNKTRFDQVFASTLLFKMDSPRKVIRYCNALQFSLPLMNREVNFVDLVLLEGIKIFYPQHYVLIKESQRFILRDHTKNWDKEDVEVFKQEYDTACSGLTKKDNEIIKSILIDLFPTLKGYWLNMSFPPDILKTWLFEKRMVTRQYFTRYLTFSLNKTDVSDRAFDSLLMDIKKSDPNKIANLITEFGQQYDIGGVIQKFRLIEDTFTDEEAVNISKGLSQVSNQFPKFEGFMGITASPFNQAAMFVAYLICNLDHEDRRLPTAEDLIIRASSFEFAFEVNRWIRNISATKSVFSAEQFEDMGIKLKDRCIQESSPEVFFVKFPEQAPYILSVWCIRERESVIEYIKVLIDKRFEYSIDLLKSIVGNTYVLTTGGVQLSDFKSNILEFVNNTIGAQWLYDLFESKFGNGFYSDVILETRSSNEQTPENLVKQFMHWYKKSKES